MEWHLKRRFVLVALLGLGDKTRHTFFREIATHSETFRKGKKD